MATIMTKVVVTTATGTQETPYNLGTGDTYTVTTISFKGISGGAVEVQSGAYAEGTNLSFNACKAEPDDNYAYGGAVSNSGTITFQGDKTTKFSINSANGSTGYSTRGGALYNDATGVITFKNEASFTDNTVSGGTYYGDAIFNMGTITFEKNVTFSGNSTKDSNYFAVYNVGTINFAKTMTLSTAKDGFNNNAYYQDENIKGTLNWDLSGATSVTDSAKLVNWQYLYPNSDKGTTLAITVKAEDQLKGSYVIATGATEATTQSFTLKNNTDATTATITVGGDAVEYKGLKYTLAQDTTAGTLTLTAAAAAKPTTLYVDGSWTAESCGGHTWGVDAFNTIQSAVDAADVSSGVVTINVNAGTYNEKVRFFDSQGGARIPKSNLAFTESETTWYGRLKFVAEEGKTVTVTGGFEITTDTQGCPQNIANVEITGFTFNDLAYPIYIMNTSGTSKGIVVTNNTLNPTSGGNAQIYVNSKAVDGLTVTGNTVNNTSGYSATLGGNTGTNNNTLVSGNTFGNNIGIFGAVGNDNVTVSNNIFTSTTGGDENLWINNGKGTQTGKVIVSGNTFSSAYKYVIGFNNTYDTKSDIVIGEGNTYGGNAVSGWASSTDGTLLMSKDAHPKEALFYTGKLYLGGDTTFATFKDTVAAVSDSTTTTSVVFSAGTYTGSDNYGKQNFVNKGTGTLTFSTTGAVISSDPENCTGTVLSLGTATDTARFFDETTAEKFELAAGSNLTVFQFQTEKYSNVLYTIKGSMTTQSTYATKAATRTDIAKDASLTVDGSIRPSANGTAFNNYGTTNVYGTLTLNLNEINSDKRIKIGYTSYQNTDAKLNVDGGTVTVRGVASAAPSWEEFDDSNPAVTKIYADTNKLEGDTAATLSVINGGLYDTTGAIENEGIVSITIDKADTRQSQIKTASFSGANGTITVDMTDADIKKQYTLIDDINGGNDNTYGTINMIESGEASEYWKTKVENGDLIAYYGKPEIVLYSTTQAATYAGGSAAAFTNDNRRAVTIPQDLGTSVSGIRTDGWFATPGGNEGTPGMWGLYGAGNDTTTKTTSLVDGIDLKTTGNGVAAAINQYSGSAGLDLKGIGAIKVENKESTSSALGIHINGGTDTATNLINIEAASLSVKSTGSAKAIQGSAAGRTTTIDIAGDVTVTGVGSGSAYGTMFSGGTIQGKMTLNFGSLTVSSEGSASTYGLHCASSADIDVVLNGNMTVTAPNYSVTGFRLASTATLSLSGKKDAQEKPKAIDVTLNGTDGATGADIGNGSNSTASLALAVNNFTVTSTNQDSTGLQLRNAGTSATGSINNLTLNSAKEAYAIYNTGGAVDMTFGTISATSTTSCAYAVYTSGGTVELSGKDDKAFTVSAVGAAGSDAYAVYATGNGTITFNNAATLTGDIKVTSGSGITLASADAKLSYSGAWSNAGTITVDMTGADTTKEYVLIDDTTGSSNTYGTVTVTGDQCWKTKEVGGDLVAYYEPVASVKVGETTTYYSTFAEAMNAAAAVQDRSATNRVTVTILENATASGYDFNGDYSYITIEGQSGSKVTGDFYTTGGGTNFSNTIFKNLNFVDSKITLTTINDFTNFTIEGCTLDGTNRAAVANPSAITFNVQNATGKTTGIKIKNNTIKNYTTSATSGIVVNSGAVSDMEISGNTFNNIAHNAIQVLNVADLKVSGNNVTNIGKAVFNINNSSASFSNNTVALTTNSFISNANKLVKISAGNSISASDLTTPLTDPKAIVQYSTWGSKDPYYNNQVIFITDNTVFNGNGKISGGDVFACEAQLETILANPDQFKFLSGLDEGKNPGEPDYDEFTLVYVTNVANNVCEVSGPIQGTIKVPTGYTFTMTADTTIAAGTKIYVPYDQGSQGLTNWTAANIPAAQAANVTVNGWVCAIGDDKYYSFSEAVTAVAAGQTITLLCNISDTEAISTDKTFSINLNGYNYANTETLTTSGKITLTDSTTPAEAAKFSANITGTGSVEVAGKVALDNTTSAVQITTTAAGALSADGLTLNNSLNSNGTLNLTDSMINVTDTSVKNTSSETPYSTTYNYNNAIWLKGNSTLTNATITETFGTENMQVRVRGIHVTGNDTNVQFVTEKDKTTTITFNRDKNRDRSQTGWTYGISLGDAETEDGDTAAMTFSGAGDLNITGNNTGGGTNPDAPYGYALNGIRINGNNNVMTFANEGKTTITDSSMYGVNGVVNCGTLNFTDGTVLINTYIDGGVAFSNNIGLYNSDASNINVTSNVDVMTVFTEGAAYYAQPGSGDISSGAAAIYNVSYNGGKTAINAKKLNVLAVSGEDTNKEWTIGDTTVTGHTTYSEAKAAAIGEGKYSTTFGIKNAGEESIIIGADTVTDIHTRDFHKNSVAVGAVAYVDGSYMETNGSIEILGNTTILAEGDTGTKALYAADGNFITIGSEGKTVSITGDILSTGSGKTTGSEGDAKASSITLLGETVTVTGSIEAADGGTISLNNAAVNAVNVTITGSASSVAMDYTGSISFSGDWSNTGTFTVDMTDATEAMYKLADYTGTTATMDLAAYGTVTLTGDYTAFALNNDLYAVSNKAVAKIGNVYYVTLQEAVDAAEDNDTVTLVKDTSENVVYSGNKKFTIDLNDCIWSNTEADQTAFKVNNASAKVTIKDEGTNKTGSITLKDGLGFCVWTRQGEVVINSGSFTTNDNNDYAIYAGGGKGTLEEPYLASKVTINGGTFTNLNTQPYVWNPALKSLNLNVQNGNENAEILVNGGSFTAEAKDDSGISLIGDATASITRGTLGSEGTISYFKTVADAKAESVAGETIVLFAGDESAASVFMEGRNLTMTDGKVASVYGGLDARTCKTTDPEQSITGDIAIIIEDGTVTGAAESGQWKGGIYGGGIASKVNGNTSVTITGGNISGNVVGGGYTGRDAKNSFTMHDAIVTGNTSVTITGTVENKVTINGNIAGGGFSHNAVSGTYSDAGVGGTATVVISNANINGTFVTGGVGTQGMEGKATIAGNISMTISDSVIDANIAGGGYGLQGGSPSVFAPTITTELTNVTAKKAVYGAYRYVDTDEEHMTTDAYLTINSGTYTGQVYGGSYQDDSKAKHTNVKNTHLTILDGSFASAVYGGGANAKNAGDTNLSISGGTFEKIVSGGSNNGIVGGNVTMDISGGIFKGKVTANNNVVNGSAVMNITGGTFNQAVRGNYDNTCTVVDGSTLNLNYAEGKTITLASTSTIENFDAVNVNTDITLGGAMKNIGNITIATDKTLSANVGNNVITYSGDWTNSGTLTVDMTGADDASYKLVDYTGSKTVTSYGEVTLANNTDDKYVTVVANNDLWAVKAQPADLTIFKVNTAWAGQEIGAAIVDQAGYYYGINAFSTLSDAMTSATALTTGVKLYSDAVLDTGDDDITLLNNVTVSSGDGNAYTATWNGGMFKAETAKSITFASDIKVNAPVSGDAGAYNNATVIYEGETDLQALWAVGGNVEVTTTGKVTVADEWHLRRNANLTVTGTITDTTKELSEYKPQISGGWIWNTNNKAKVTASFNNTYVKTGKIQGSYADGNNVAMEIIFNRAIGNFTGDDFGIGLDLTQTGTVPEGDTGHKLILNDQSRVLSADLTLGNAVHTAYAEVNGGSSLEISGAVTIGTGSTLNVNGSSLKASSIANSGSVNVTGTSKLSTASYTGTLTVGKVGEATTLTTDGLISTGGVDIVDGSTVTLSGNGFSFGGMFNNSVENYNETTHVGHTLNVKDAEAFTAWGFYANGGSTVNVTNVKDLDVQYFNVYGGTVNVMGSGKDQYAVSANEAIQTTGQVTLNRVSVSAGYLKVYGAKSGKNGGSVSISDSDVSARFVTVGSETTEDKKYYTDGTVGASMTLTNSTLLVNNIGGEADSYLKIGAAGSNGTLTLTNSKITYNQEVYPSSAMNVTIAADSSLIMDADSSITASSITNAGALNAKYKEVGSAITFNGNWTNSGTFTVDMTNATKVAYKLVDYTGSDTITAYGTVNVGTEYTTFVLNNDLYAVKGGAFTTDVTVNSAYEAAGYEYGDITIDGKLYGYNAFADLESAFTVRGSDIVNLTIVGRVMMEDNYTLGTKGTLTVSDGATLSVSEQSTLTHTLYDFTNLETINGPATGTIYLNTTNAVKKVVNYWSGKLGEGQAVKIYAATTAGSGDLEDETYLDVITADEESQTEIAGEGKVVISQDITTAGTSYTNIMLKANEEYDETANKNLTIAGNVTAADGTINVVNQQQKTLEVIGDISAQNINILNGADDDAKEARPEDEKDRSGKFTVSGVVAAAKDLTVTTISEEHGKTRNIEFGYETHTAGGELTITNAAGNTISGGAGTITYEEVEVAAVITANFDADDKVVINNAGNLSTNVATSSTVNITNSGTLNGGIAKYGSEDPKELAADFTASGAVEIKNSGHINANIVTDSTIKVTENSSSDTFTGTLKGQTIEFTDNTGSIKDALLIAYGTSATDLGKIEIVGNSAASVIEDSDLYAGWSEAKSTEGTWTGAINLYGSNTVKGETAFNGNLNNLVDAEKTTTANSLTFDAGSEVAVTGNLTNGVGAAMTVAAGIPETTEEPVTPAVDAADVTVSGTLTNNGTITVSGTMTVTGTAESTSTGVLTVAGSLTTGAFTNAGTITVAGATEASMTTGDFTSSNAVVLGSVSGTDPVTVTGTGTLSVKDYNVTAAAGTLTIHNDSVLKYSGDLLYNGAAPTTSQKFITIDAYDDGKAHLVIDYALESGDTGYAAKDLAYYAARIKDWDATKFYVINNDLYYNDSTVMYVNSNYTAELNPDGFTKDGHVVGLNAFTTFAAAQDYAEGHSINLTKIVSTESRGADLYGTTATSTFSGTSTMNFNTVEFIGSTASTTYGGIIGGNRLELSETRVWENVSGEVNLTIKSGNFTQNVIGGSYVQGVGSVYQEGNINLKIEGGTFAEKGIVAGGMFFNETSYYDSAALKGNITLDISGGTFNCTIICGNISKNDDRYSACTLVEGDITLSIDASENEITFNKQVFAGSRYAGTVFGNTTVNLTGSGENLHFNGSTLSGGCGADFRETESNETFSWVDGYRHLAFKDYNGDLDARLIMFTDVTMKDSNVKLVRTTGMRDSWLFESSEWNMDNSSLTGDFGNNDFTEDAINLKYNDSEEWTLGSSKIVFDAADADMIADWQSAESVTINGIEAHLDINNEWRALGSTYDFTFGLGEDDTQLVVTKTAKLA